MKLKPNIIYSVECDSKNAPILFTKRDNNLQDSDDYFQELLFWGDIFIGHDKSCTRNPRNCIQGYNNNCCEICECYNCSAYDTPPCSCENCVCPYSFYYRQSLSKNPRKIKQPKKCTNPQVIKLVQELKARNRVNKDIDQWMLKKVNNGPYIYEDSDEDDEDDEKTPKRKITVASPPSRPVSRSFTSRKSRLDTETETISPKKLKYDTETETETETETTNVRRSSRIKSIKK